MGEKYIYNNNKFNGSFLNLTTRTTRKTMTLAVLEGVSFALKGLSEQISNKYNQVKVIGGGMKSKLWKKIFATTFQRKIWDYSPMANAVVGAIKIAQIGYLDIDEHPTYIKVEATDLDSKLVDHYSDKYALYLSAVENMNQFYK